MGNTFVKIFKLTTFGESHGKAIGGVIDGCPAGLKVDFDFIQKQLDRRKPGQSKITTARKESDIVEFLSGIFEGVSTGTPIGFIIKNEDIKSKDYSHLKETYRPSHADFTYQAKYGIRDYRGGGRSSARETACRVVVGAIAQQILAKIGVQIRAYVSAVGSVKMNKLYKDLDLSSVDELVVSGLSDIPFLKLLIPLATSPIKDDILPLPKRRTTKTTTIAICQKPILILSIYTIFLTN